MSDESNTILYHRILNANNANRHPLPRSGHRIVYCSGNIYAVGGYVQSDARLEVVGEIWRFNLLTGTWWKLRIIDFPFSLAASHSVCQIGHSVIIHGGTGTTFGQNIDNSLFLVNLHEETCCQLPNRAEDDNIQNLPIPTYGHTTTLVNLDNEALVYKVGGCMSYSFTMNVYCYSLRRQSWRCVYDMDRQKLSAAIPMPRYRHDTGVYNEKLVIIGGGDLSAATSLHRLDVFDLRSNTWGKWWITGHNASGLRYQSSVQIGKVMYIFGGVADNEQFISKEIFYLDMETKQYTFIRKQLQSAYFHDVCFNPDQNCIYSFGGIPSVIRRARCNTLHSFHIATMVTPLAEVAWNEVVRLIRGDAVGISTLRKVLNNSLRNRTSGESEYHATGDELQPDGDLKEVLSELRRQSLDATQPGSNAFSSPITTAKCHAAILTATTVTYLTSKYYPEPLEEDPTLPGSSSRLLFWANLADDENSNLLELAESLCRKALKTERTEVRPEVPRRARNSNADRGGVFFTMLSDVLVDELFLVWLFYLMNIPDRFIHRLSNGQVFLTKVKRLHKRWPSPLFT